MLDADQGTCGDDTDDAIRAPVVLDDGYRQLQTTAQTVKDAAKKKKKKDGRSEQATLFRSFSLASVKNIELDRNSVAFKLCQP